MYFFGGVEVQKTVVNITQYVIATHCHKIIILKSVIFTWYSIILILYVIPYTYFIYVHVCVHICAYVCICIYIYIFFFFFFLILVSP